jgi:3-isopropylmalate/(R)-2-methylmalate dehydratase small subunit
MTTSGATPIPSSFRGRVWIFGDDVNTDLVIPAFAQYLTAEEMAPHCFSANRPGWVDEMSPGDVIVAGQNFGVGSARNIGAVFRVLGIAGIVAESFNGLAMRGCLNEGLPILPCPGARAAFTEGDEAEVDWCDGLVTNRTTGATARGRPVPPPLQDIARHGGVEAILRAEGFLRAEST